MRNSFFSETKRGGLFFTLWVLFLVFSTSAFAQVQKTERQAPPMEQLPQEQNQLAISYDDEIKKDELPETVITSINENYSEFEISEVYRGSDGSFKVKLDNEEKEIAAFYDAGGEFLRIEHEKPEEMQEENINDDWR